MIIKPAPPVGEMVNAFGQDYVAFKSRGRQLLRQWVNPFQPDTSIQLTLRNYFAQIAAAWKDVNDAQAAAWETLNENLERTDSLGSNYGFFLNNAFMQVNFYRLLDGQAITYDAPSYVYIAPATAVSSVARTAPNTFTVTFTHVNSSSTFFFLQMTTNLGSQRRKARRNDLRIGTAVIADSVVPRAASPQAIVNGFTRLGLPDTEPAWVGVRLVSLSPGYVPGGVLFIPSLEVSYP